VKLADDSDENDWPGYTLTTSPTSQQYLPPRRVSNTVASDRGLMAIIREAGDQALMLTRDEHEAMNVSPPPVSRHFVSVTSAAKSNSNNTCSELPSPEQQAVPTSHYLLSVKTEPSPITSSDVMSSHGNSKQFTVSWQGSASTHRAGRHVMSGGFCCEVSQSATAASSSSNVVVSSPVTIVADNFVSSPLTASGVMSTVVPPVVVAMPARVKCDSVTMIDSISDDAQETGKLPAHSNSLILTVFNSLIQY